MNNQDLDISNLINISKEELESKYNVLKESHKSLQIELESKNQLIYDNKRQLQIYEQLEKDFQQEIEMIQKMAKCEVEKYELKVQRLEENVSDLNDRNQYLETCMFEREEEKVHLEFELKELAGKVSLDKEKLETVDDNCQREIRELKEENEQLRKENEELLLEIKLLKEEIATFEEKYEAVNVELENIKDNLSCKKSELAECKSVCTSLQEEVAVLKNELEGLRSKPLDKETKGNSLFAEVNDKRLELQEKMCKIKQKYLEMRKDYGNKLLKISELRAENQKLSQQLEENTKLQIQDYEYVISTQKTRIDLLEALLEKAKTEDAVRNRQEPENAVDDVFKFVDAMLEPKNKEIAELKERLNVESQTKMLTAVHLSDSNKELRKWKAVGAQLKCRIDELESKISELEHLTSPPSLEDDVFETDDGNNVICQSADIKSIKLRDDSGSSDREIEQQNCAKPNMKNIDCSRNSKKMIKNIQVIDVDDNSFNSSCDNKENVTATNSQIDKEKRVVTFSAETVEKTNEKYPLRKGGRVLDTKAVYIPSKPKRNK